MTNTVRCCYNAVKFLRNPHNRHSICPPVRVRCGVSLVSTNSDLYSVPATLSMFTISCYIGPRCGGTRLHIICVESDYTCAQMNQGWRPIHVDIHISLIYEYYAASLLYRAKLYVIRIIFIIFHICATLPSPDLHLTEMVCFQCFIKHHFDEGADFEALLRQARIAEQEPCNSATHQSLLGQNQDKFDTIMQQLIELNSKVKELEAKMSETGRPLTNQNPDSIVCAPASTTLSPVKLQPQDFETTRTQQFPGRCYACGRTGHKRGSSECSKTGSAKGLRPVDGAKPGVGLEGLNSGGGLPKNPDIEVVRASSAKVDSITSSDDPDIERDVHSPLVDEPGVIGLVGPSCEVTVTLEDTSCQALLDTGSMVSTVTYSLAHKLKLDIHPWTTSSEWKMWEVRCFSTWVM